MIRILRLLEYTYDTAEAMIADMAKWAVSPNGQFNRGLNLPVRICSAVLLPTIFASPESSSAVPAFDPKFVVDTRIECRDNSPDWWVGRWQDWHRGHGCSKDDGAPVSPDGVAEFAAAGRLPGRAAPATLDDRTKEN